jgi:hypothetical protein
LTFAFRTRGQDDSECQIHSTSTTTIVGQPAVLQLAGVGTLPAQMVRYFSARPDSEAWTELATKKQDKVARERSQQEVYHDERPRQLANGKRKKRL